MQKMRAFFKSGRYFLIIATGSPTNFFGNKNIERYALPIKLRSLILQSF
ncbi:MAG: hypothetical protein ACFIN3_01170 [Candidatus Walczuchella monophlebidarum]